MTRFHVDPSTRMIVGDGAFDELGRYAPAWGDRALLVTGAAHARAHGILARAQGQLQQAGVTVELLEGIRSNPTVAMVDAGAMLARAHRATCVIGLGGGSVIDVAKAIAVAAAEAHPRSFREHLSGLRTPHHLVDSALPVLAVPTLPGSGSESNGTSVITDEQTGRKLSAHTDLATPRLTIIDPDLAIDASRDQVAPGLIDALCHALEAGCSTRANIASDSLAEQAVHMLLRDTVDACAAKSPDRRREALLSAWWASNLAGQALTMAGSIITHPLAHALSAHCDTRHGTAVAAFEPWVLAGFGDELIEHGTAVKLARWMNVRGLRDPEVALRGVIDRLVRMCEHVGMSLDAEQLGLTEALVSLIVRDARASGSRGLSALPGGEPSAERLLALVDAVRRADPDMTGAHIRHRARALR